MTRKLAKHHEESLKPFAELLHELKSVVHSLNDRQLKELLKACAKVEPENCSWATHDAAAAVLPHAKKLAEFRKIGKTKKRAGKKDRSS